MNHYIEDAVRRAIGDAVRGIWPQLPKGCTLRFRRPKRLYQRGAPGNGRLRLLRKSAGGSNVTIDGTPTNAHFCFPPLVCSPGTGSQWPNW